MVACLFYLASIVAINFGFEHTSVVPLYGDTVWPPMSVAAGVVFVLRDYAQRAVGVRPVVLWMLTGAALSYILASPAIALASLMAFVVSEAVDWIVYTTSKRTFAQRVLISSLASAPIDSVVFLHLINMLSPASVVVMTLSKAAGIGLCAWAAMGRKEK